MTSKYYEIQKLHRMLLDAGIEHEWNDRRKQMIPDHEWESLRKRVFWKETDFGWQVRIYKPNGEFLISAIEGFGSYGVYDDLIEIMGLTENDDDVEGYLTAEDVFERIRRALL